MSSCADFDGWNVDTKHPSKVSAEALVTNAEEMIALRMSSTSVNYNIFKMLAQYWTETTYTDEANYDLVNRNIGGNFWTNMYDILNDLNDAKIIVEEDGSLSATTKANKKAIIDLMEVYIYHVMVDTYGDIPYSEAIDINNVLPKYDNDEDIYNDLFARLDSDISALSNGGSSFGSADLFYGGDVSKWKKFANSLKLRMAVRVEDANKAAAAVTGGVFTSNADNFKFNFLSEPPHTNPIWSSLVQSGRHDFVVTNTFVDKFFAVDPGNLDTRVDEFMDDNLGANTYVGGPYGDNNSYASYTHIGAPFHTPDLPAVLLGYSEVEFLLAEAAERSMVGAPVDAEGHYNNGVTASFEEWGNTATEATAYLAQPTVAYATAAPTWQEKIGVQKWIALYGKGFEGWSSWRKLGYPAMNAPAVSGLPVPRRYIYPNNEPDVNGANYNAATAAMGGDLLSSRVFWDN